MIGSSLAAVGIAVGIVIAYEILFRAYVRWVLPGITRRWIDKTLQKIQSGKFVRPTKRSNFGISFDAQGFVVSQIRPKSTPQLSIIWSDVLRVTAFKRDWLTVDCICLAINTSDGTTTEVNEEMEGWEAFTEALPTYLPGCLKWADCFSQVAFPAFATNETQIFAREGSPGESKSGAG